MPTIILLDTSLSMMKFIKSDPLEQVTLRDIAHMIIQDLVEIIKRVDKYEQIALICFSSNSEIKCEFTLEAKKLITSLDSIKTGSQSNYEKALIHASKYLIEEHGSCTFAEIILITDGINSYYNKTQMENTEELGSIISSYPNRIDIICLNNDINNKHENLHDLIKMNGYPGNLLISKNLDMNYLKNEIIQKLIEDVYEPQVYELKCGHLNSKIVLTPKPRIFRGLQNYSFIEREIGNTIEINGFFHINDFQTPTFISEHMIYSTQSELDNEEGSFVALLYSGLKSENSVALVKLADDWYGYIHCWSESKNEPKKKSNLILTIFKPGSESIDEICGKVVCKPQVADDSQTPIIPNEPPKQVEIKSYAKNCISWLKSTDLQNDIQKILRHAKKMPEKSQIFFKELNRVRRAALSFGFYELLDGLAKLLERERNTLNNQEAVAQLNHSINSLRSSQYKEFKNDINPISLRK